MPGAPRGGREGPAHGCGAGDSVGGGQVIANAGVRLPAGPRIWSTEVAGGRMHTIVDGRAVVVPTRADLKLGRSEK